MGALAHVKAATFFLAFNILTVAALWLIERILITAHGVTAIKEMPAGSNLVV
jgi:hypothetical protein